jgi:hypothetical protein
MALRRLLSSWLDYGEQRNHGRLSQYTWYWAWLGIQSLEGHCREQKRNILFVHGIDAGQKALVSVYIFPSLDRTELSSRSHAWKEQRVLTRASWLEQLAAQVSQGVCQLPVQFNDASHKIPTLSRLQTTNGDGLWEFEVSC